MSLSLRDISANKADRALELHEKGLPRLVIAERLCVNPKNIAGMMQRARQRRAKKLAVPTE